jgi:hypothetical protein
MESKDYERYSETIIIPPVHVGLRCDNRLPIWEQPFSVVIRESLNHTKILRFWQCYT